MTRYLLFRADDIIYERTENLRSFRAHRDKGCKLRHALDLSASAKRLHISLIITLALLTRMLALNSYYEGILDFNHPEALK